MSRKHKCLSIGLTVMLALGLALFLWPRDRITADSWEKIRIGMTEQEIEDILGAPGENAKEVQAEWEALARQLGREPFAYDGTYFEEPIIYLDIAPGMGRMKKWADEDNRIWKGRRGIMGVQFDCHGRVAWSFYQGMRLAEPSIFDRLRDFLGR
jgi:hypothetical protein